MQKAIEFFDNLKNDVYVYDLFALIDSMDVNYVNENGYTPLMALVSSIPHRPEVLRYLLKNHKININMKSTYNHRRAALHMATPSALGFLVDHGGIDINIIDDNGYTALMIAVVHFQPSAIEILLQHANIDVNVRNYKDESALLLAARLEPEAFEILLQDQRIRESDDMYPALLILSQYIPRARIRTLNIIEEILIIAAEHNPKLLKYILDTYPDVNVNYQDLRKQSALMVAAKYQPDAVLHLVNDHRTDVNMGFPLFIAAGLQPRAFHHLLKRVDIDISIRNENGINALMHAGSIEVIDYLLDKVDVNQRDFKGYTALMYMINTFPKGVINLLRHENININATTMEGESALMMACLHGTNVEVLLKSKKINVNIQDKQGNTALMRVCKSTNKSEVIIKQFLKDGRADVNLRNKEGECALHIRMHYGCIKDVLQFTGIDVNVQDIEGKTALMLGIIHDNYENVKLLLSIPTIKVNLADEDGMTCLAFAMNNMNNIDTLQQLLSHPNICGACSRHLKIRKYK